VTGWQNDASVDASLCGARLLLTPGALEARLLHGEPPRRWVVVIDRIAVVDIGEALRVFGIAFLLRLELALNLLELGEGLSDARGGETGGHARIRK